MGIDVTTTTGNVLVRICEEDGQITPKGPLANVVTDLISDHDADMESLRAYFSGQQYVVQDTDDTDDPPEWTRPKAPGNLADIFQGRKKGGTVKAEFDTIAKVDEDKRLVFGWAYVTHDRSGQLVIDKSGEFIDDPEELEKAAYDYVVMSRVGGNQHAKNDDGSAIQVGTMVESIVFTREKMEKMGIPEGTLPTAWWVGFRVDDDAAWQDVKDGKKRGFSIRGKAMRKAV